MVQLDQLSPGCSWGLYTSEVTTSEGVVSSVPNAFAFNAIFWLELYIVKPCGRDDNNETKGYLYGYACTPTVGNIT